MLNCSFKLRGFESIFGAEWRNWDPVLDRIVKKSWNCFDTHSENTSDSKALYHCVILNQYAGVQNQSKEKWVAVQILMDCTAPATSLAQSPFLIRNPRQVTNTLYHLWYVGALILRWKNRKCGADRQMGVPDNSLQTHHRTSLKEQTRWIVATKPEARWCDTCTCWCWTTGLFFLAIVIYFFYLQVI